MANSDFKPAELSRNALTVLKKRYLRKSEQGEIIETPDEMFWRVARNIASADSFCDPEADVEARTEEFYRLMVSLEFLPNSPTLMNAGLALQQLSACFVLPVEDSISSIFEAVKQAALIHQSGGGTGFSFSRLRPRGDIVHSTMSTASGPVSFMKVFNEGTETIKQGGKRRGANMGVLRVDHPDIMEFIRAKENYESLTNFNISVVLTEDFMRALENDEEYDLINPRTKQVVDIPGKEKRLRARDVFDQIVKMAWRNGDPGIVFLDRVNAANPTPLLGEIESTNPCGEQPLLPFESCNLGSINLAKMVKKGQIDYERLERVIRTAVRFLDNVIDMNKYPLPQIEEMTKGNRKIGLGVMGFADMLVRLGVPYNSEQAIAVAEEVMKFIDDKAKETSAELAEERGVFPNFKGSVYDVPGGPKMRNATVTTIAPTGSISIIAGASSGIEPYFALVFHKKHILGGEQLVEVNPLFEKVAKERGFYSEELMQRMAERGSCQGLAEVPQDMQRLFVTAHEISSEWHVRIQAAFQKYVDNAVSKTTNLPHDATEEEVRRAYRLAYELGTKGLTIYRDGSRPKQVLNLAARKEDVQEPAAELKAVVEISGLRDTLFEKGPQKQALKPRPHVVSGKTYRQKTPLGTAFITVTDDGESGEPLEVFINIGKAGSDTAAVAEALGRLISLCLRLLSPLPQTERVKEMVGQLSGIGGGRSLGYGPNRVRSLPDAIARVLAEHIGLAKREINHGQLPLPMGDLCPECGQATLVTEEGCHTCYTCGFSDC